MDKIIVLDDSLINKIAAGEVIERPASVVKELIENSIDAGSTQITIELRDGGKELIRVTDNGTGMDRENAMLACERHATSKIRTADDLFRIHTLGFRGEALASMAAVSDLTLTTSTGSSISGTRIVISGGKTLSAEDFGCPKGTTVEIKDLFFNTPARRKYMKTADTEMRYISDIVQRYALIHPGIHFRLVHNSNDVLNSPATVNPLANIAYVYGRSISKELLPLEYSSAGIEIRGFISKPALSRGDRSEQSIYVNKRYVKNKTISDALNDAYHTLMMVERYPLAVLDISMPAAEVDVNVHPAKAEIRLENDKLVYDTVFSAVRKTLTENDLIPERDIPEKNAVLFTGKPSPRAREPEARYALEKASQHTLSPGKSDVSLETLPDMVVHGVVNRTYILAETRNELLIIDQHAAAERILYERFMEQYMKKAIPRQALLDPIIVELSPRESAVLAENLQVFSSLGFILDEFGQNTFILREVPSVFNRIIDRSVMFSLINEVTSPGQQNAVATIKEERIMKMACRGAIKAGDIVNIREIRHYMNELDKRNVPFTCPHGRPVIIKITFGQLEKMFKRKL